MGNKIIAREVPPSQRVFSSYFDNDGFREVGGKNCAVYIIKPEGWSRYSGFQIDEYTDILRKMDHANEIVGIEKWDTDKPEHVAAYLTETTGEKWSTRNFTGYVQGDYCTVLYCISHYTDEGITELGKFWMGCGAEFDIGETGGYFVIDDIRWEGGDRLRDALADMYGCNRSDLTIELCTGERTIMVADYQTI